MPLTREQRVVVARTLAVVADAVQLGLWPMFVPGAWSALNDALDVVVGAALVLLVGWHWSFVPSFVAELVPMVDLVPSWTAAVLLATRGTGPAPAAPVSRPGSGTGGPQPPATTG